MSATGASRRFPKSARLLKSREFKLYPSKRLQTQSFTFVYSTAGSGRLGISISKKVLKRANARNRIKRLLREVFRHNLERLGGVDVHVIAAPPLRESWDSLQLKDVEGEFQRLLGKVA